MTQEEHYRQDWMTDDQWECANFFADLFYGWHHMPGKVKPWARGIELNASRGGFATYDFNNLTRAVFMAHDRCIRIEFTSSGPGMIKLIAHKRHAREGALYERHPTLDQAVKEWKERQKP